MARLSPEARQALDGFVAARTPDPGRRRRNLEATLARLDEDPLDEPVVVRTRLRWILVIAAAVAIAIATASLLRESIALRDATPTPSQAASAPVATPTHAATEPVPAVLPEAPAARAEPTDDAATRAEPTDHAPTVATPPAATPQPPPPTRRPTPAPTLAEQLALETALLSRIRDAVDTGDDAEALALLRRHAREFPRGAMLEDRQALLAIVGCRSGAATADDTAAAFVRAHARSPYAAAVRRACASASPDAKSE
jgi:hypothetical protein